MGISAASKIAWHITKQSEQLTQLALTNPIAGFKAFYEKLPLLKQKRAKVRAGWILQNLHGSTLSLIRWVAGNVKLGLEFKVQLWDTNYLVDALPIQFSKLHGPFFREQYT